jgi:class 3 adenylate cyclase
MTRRAHEGLLAAVLLLAWGICAGATALTLYRGTGYPPFFVSPDAAGGAPVVSAFRPTLLGGSPGALRLGDDVLAVNGVDVSGLGAAGFFVRFIELVPTGGPTAITYRRDGATATTTVVPGSMRVLVPLLLVSPVFVVVALILWLRARQNAAAWAFTLALVDIAFYLVANFGGAPATTWTAMILHLVAMTLVGPLTVRAFLLFPDRARLRPSERQWPWLFAVLGFLHTAYVGTPAPPRLGNALAALVVAALQVVCVAIATRAYRRADPVGRRRLKWVLFGVYCAAAPPLAGALLSAVDPAYINVYFLTLAAVACLPLALLIAIRRVNLFDIDRVISIAGSYNLLIAAGVIIGVTVIPRAAQAAAQLLGIDPNVGQLGLSGMLGLAIFYAQRRLRPRIERLFFAERYALDGGVHDLVLQLRDAPDVECLVRDMADRLHRLVRPSACVVYARGDGGYIPLLAHGGSVPPRLALDGPLMATLEGRRRPLALGAPAALDARLDPFERAVLETLDAEVVVPIRRGPELALLLCLGGKRSGDVYTPTDVRLLGTVGETASQRLEHFAQSAVIAQTRQMRDALRRYVPATVAEAIGHGDDLRPAERDITVMFVDLRGYTALCEPLPPQDVFALTDRFTAVVSKVLRRHGGNLVEFSGDGLMAVFGAPAALAGKERAAVAAADELVTALETEGPRRPDGSALAVGIGIATGVAHCGNIRSADQVIWTAVGNVVNFAARLQSLTRDLDALIAIDVPTRNRAGDLTAAFLRRDEVRVRGRSRAEAIYYLPLSTTANAAGFADSSAALTAKSA